MIYFYGLWAAVVVGLYDLNLNLLTLHANIFYLSKSKCVTPALNEIICILKEYYNTYYLLCMSRN